MNRIRLLVFILGCLTCGLLWAGSVWDHPIPNSDQTKKITVYRSPTCSCCGLWIDHLVKHGFEINDIKTNDMQAVKSRYGVKNEWASCHTALVDGYVVEGHVPAADIRKMIQEKPEIIGISVPQMPHGTPGMEMSGRKDPFSVISFDRDGNGKSFTDYLFY